MSKPDKIESLYNTEEIEQDRSSKDIKTKMSDKLVLSILQIRNSPKVVKSIKKLI